MIVDKFKLRSQELGDIAIFDLNAMSIDNPYILKGLTGISASEITENNYGYSSSGQSYYEMVPSARDISMKIGLNPVYSSSGIRQDLRNVLYKSISSSRSPSISFDAYNGNQLLATIEGIIVKLDASHFTDKPEVDLTIRCKSPFFKGPSRTTVDVSTFTSNSITINYSNGNAPVGFTASFKMDVSTSSFGIAPADNSWVFSVEYPFSNYDILQFSSEEGNKSVSVYRPSEQVGENTGITNLADKITSNSNWPIIFPGQNNFLTTVDPVQFTFLSCSYHASFWGV